MSITDQHRGKTFVFHSPFNDTPGWRDGEKGKLIRLLKPPVVDPEIEDLWLARNEQGEEREIWGGEAFSEDGSPAIPEHAFIGWIPEAR